MAHRPRHSLGEIPGVAMLAEELEAGKLPELATCGIIVPRAPLIMEILEAFKLAVFYCGMHRAYVPGVILLMKVLKANELARFCCFTCRAYIPETFLLLQKFKACNMATRRCRNSRDIVPEVAVFCCDA